MAFTLNCPHCACLVSAPDPAPGQTYEGKKGRCLSCNGIVDLSRTRPVENFDLQAAEEVKPSAQPQAGGVKAASADAIPVATSQVLTPLSKPVASKKASSFWIIVIVVVLFMCGGGIVVGGIFLLPMYLGARGAVRTEMVKLAVHQIANAQDVHFKAQQQYAASLGELKAELSSIAPQGIGDAIVAAEAPPGAGKPYSDYLFKILKAQGANAPGGAKSYMDAAGKMTEGCAILAYPANMSGPRNTIFILATDKNLHALDVAPELAETVRALETYDPNPNWRKLP